MKEGISGFITVLGGTAAMAIMTSKGHTLD